MTEFNPEYFLALARAYHQVNPTQRYGQAFYNNLRLFYPEIVKHIQGTPIDPFDHDERVPDVLEFMREWFRDGPMLPRSVRR